MIHRAGLLAIAALLTGASGCSRTPELRTATAPAQLTIQRFPTDVYGASGIAQLSDGRVLIAEDEERHPLAIVDVFGRGAIRNLTPREIKRALGSALTNTLNDLEGMTVDPQGHFYAVTSHSPTKKGEVKQERQQLVRFDLAGDRIANMQTSMRLKPALEKLDPIFTQDGGGLNIEGLAWDPEHGRLLIGFRSPRREKKALVVWLQNPGAVFTAGAEPALLPALNLDLKGEGIRDVTYSPTLHGFLIVAGTWHSNKMSFSTLWFWKAEPDMPVRLQAPGLGDLKAEGIAEVRIGEKRGLLIVSDDGTVDDLYDKGRALEDHGMADRYAVLPFDLLFHDNPLFAKELNK